jgi:hypothetical protein
VSGAKLVGVGASTALFTRFLGGMGLFKEAISDVLGEDKWLDRRNDLDDLWRRISRRIFLPGFIESNDPSASQFLEAINDAMTKTLLRSASVHHSYYSKDATRTIVIRWADEARRLITINDTLHCKISVFGKKDDEYRIQCLPTSGNALNDYELKLVSAKLDKKSIVVTAPEDGVHRIPLKGGTSHFISREIHLIQNLLKDPLVIVSSGHVCWGMDVTIVNEIAELSLNWGESGMLGVFEKMKSEPRLIQLRTREVLLPTQGIYIVLTSPPHS